MNNLAIIPSSSSTNPLLETENLIELFLKDVEERGLVGEQANASTVLLCAVSALLSSPLNLTVSGESSAGKNYLLAAVAAFIPEEHRKATSGLTPKALMHAAEDEFQHKAIFIAEYEGVAKADYAIRTMQSEKVIEWDFVDTGKGIRKKKSRVKGPAAFLQATTRPVLHPENETRLLFISLDESSEQTHAILRRQAEAAEKGELPNDEEKIKNWHDFIRSLKSMNVAIPFASNLAAHFPTERVRSRRDFPKLLGLIETSAFIHQYQREKQDGRIIASPEDYRVAKHLFENCYATGPDTKLSELLSAAQELHGKGTFRVSDLIEKTGWGKSKVYMVLARAEELGCIAESEVRGVYNFIRNSAVPPLELPEGF